MTMELQQYIESEKEEAAAVATAKVRKNIQKLIQKLLAEGRINELVEACDDDVAFDKLLTEGSSTTTLVVS